MGQTELGKEEMTPPLKPKPARSVLVTTDATVAWLPLDDGPIPVAIETKEKGRPEEVQVEEPELIGAMSAEDAGETVGWRHMEKDKEQVEKVLKIDDPKLEYNNIIPHSLTPYRTHCTLVHPITETLHYYLFTAATILKFCTAAK